MQKIWLRSQHLAWVFTHDTQSTIIFDDSQQNNSQSSSQKLTQNPKQRLSQDKARQIPSQENHLGSQNDGKKLTQKRTTICKYYKKGFCRSGKNCNFEHPKMCEVFKRNGLAKFNERGCDGKCKKTPSISMQRIT